MKQVSLQREYSKSELNDIFLLKKHIFKEKCRATLSLIESEQGYNNGRGISIRKQTNMREQFLVQSQNWKPNDTEPQDEWQFFDPMVKDFQHPLEFLKGFKEKQDTLYNPDIILPGGDSDEEENNQVEENATILESREQKNYIQEFFDKFGEVLSKSSPEFWTLVLFDILKDLCDKTQSNIALEIKYFEILHSAEAVKFLLIFRREIVFYLHKTRFWDQPVKLKQKLKGEQSTTNHQVLKAIGLDEQEIEEANRLGLRELEIKGTKGKDRKQRQEKKINLKEGLVEHDPNEYAKMDQQKLSRYFPTSSREDKPEYLKIRIDPLPRLKPKEENLVKVENLPLWIRKAFEGTQSLNVIQSAIFERAFNSEENLLVCAPTGAGKTNIALLTILQEISKRVDKETMTLKDQNFKIVYISPMKALASEIVEKFQTKLKYLGIKVKEFTGDMQLSKKELQETHIILTTPEKWDVVTRKSNQISEQLQLLIIDEIHLLNDDRGPILECVVARTVKQVERAQRLIRLVGLSATLPNYWDVAVFLQVRKEGVYFFDQTYRPVPLCQKFVGIKDPIRKPKERRNKKDIYDEQAYEIMYDVLKHGKQVLVFVHSRKETVNYAKYILDRSIRLAHQYLFQSATKDYKTMSRQNDNELGKLLPYGVGFHHAGMLRADRNIVERLFLEGHLKVLVATATLAWGVNLPAFAVIIKGTDVFDVTRADMRNLGVLDVQQMFGRAGRPQFDSQGEATLITDLSNIGPYMGMLNNASFIESKLMGFIKEALNAEVVLGNVSNYHEAYDWLNQTFFSIRLKRNPQAYGVEKEYGLDIDCDTLVEKKITEALKELDNLKLVRFDTRNQLITSTLLGRIASHYYIRCETMKVLCEQMGITFDTSLPLEANKQHDNRYQYRSMYQLLKILAKAKEFEMLRVRPEETQELRKIFQYYWVFDERPGLQFQKTGVFDSNIEEEESVIETEEKVIALISGYIAQVKYENYALVMDTHLVIQNGIRLARCMLEMALKKNQAQMVHVLLKMAKLLENRMSENRSPLAQFSKEIFQGYNSRKKTDQKEGFISSGWLQDIEEHGSKFSIQDFIEMNSNELVHIINCGYQATAIFKKFCYYLPNLEVIKDIKPIASTILKVSLSVTPNWRFSSRWHLRNEPFWVFVDDEEELLHNEEFLISQKHIEERLPVELTFFIPYNNKRNANYRLIITSDRWIMSEEYFEFLDLQNIILENDRVDFTDLLDLQPLPTRVLSKPEYERLFPFQYFNPIQTQVFHSLFHTDDNILIGSPTGSGKTIMAEFAMFRVFLQYPDKKIVYIAPMKAIAKERLKDWTKRFQSKEMGKSVLELTGDYTPDLEALMNADVLITTPEKWDGISRNWANRSYVSQSALIIFDEIHLLGQDRGPVLEVIVSRMNLIASKTGQKTRMVGLSTAMANGGDVGEWFGVKKYRFYNFKPSVRPVPVTIHFNGFPERAYCPRMATMNKPAFQDIKRHSDGKPTIIFVSSRRQTRLTAMDIIALQVHEHGSGTPPYIKCAQWEIEDYQNRAQDEYLKQTLGFGVGMHHAGLTSEDRQIVEDLFVGGKIQLLVATSTLAWGVNFPARLVIIKGTEFYDPKQKKYVDMPVTDILQMIGRAGRPQFDTQATACVYVEQSKKDFYRKYLNNPFPIESSLLGQLSDHINAEVAASTITNRQQCIDWLTWTYFFRRLMKNPSYYGLADNKTTTVKEYLVKLVDQTFRKLQESGCIKIHEDSDIIEPTFLGYLSSFYYIKHETVKHFHKEIKQDAKIEDLIRVLSYSKEFEEVPLRHNEDNMNEALSKICPLKCDNRKLDQAQEKTFLLFQSHLFRLPVPIRDFVTDTKLVIDQSIRMLHAMIDLSAEKGYLSTSLNIIYLTQMIIQGVWFTESPLVNVPYFDQTVIKELSSKGINYFCELVHFFIKEPLRLKEMLSKLLRENPNQYWSEISQSLNQVPIIDFKISLTAFDDNSFQKGEKGAPLKEGGEAIVSLFLNRTNHVHSQRVIIQKLSKVKDASWWACIGIPEEDKLLALKKIYFKQHCKKELQIQLPNNFRDSGDIFVYLLSDSYVGIDQQLKLNFRT